MKLCNSEICFHFIDWALEVSEIRYVTIHANECQSDPEKIGTIQGIRPQIF